MRIALLMVAALLLAPVAAMAADYKEGVNYTVINQGPATAKPQVTEFFSLYCPHCFAFSKSVVPELKSKLKAENVDFNQVHVSFIGGNMGLEMSKAFAIASQLKVQDKIEAALFSAIHEKNERFTNTNQIRAIFIANGVTAKEYDGAVNNFMVNAQVSQMEKATKDDGIAGVPTLVVNGKYRIENKSLKSYDEMMDLALYLSKLN